MKSNTLFKNTLFIIGTNFLIKLLGLINKILITRLLGTKGMSLYVLSFPTIMLFIGIASFSLSLTISKLVSEALVNRKYSPKKIVINSCKISFALSLAIAIIYILFLKFLVNDLLKNQDLYYPLLSGAPLILLVGISDGLKGYFIGIKRMDISSKSNLVEQIFRFSFSIASIIIFRSRGIVFATTFCILALSIGELFSIIYSLLCLKKVNLIDFKNTAAETRAILNMAVPNTLSKIIGNLTYFFEPIIFTTILFSKGYNVEKIHEIYTIFDAYTVPLLTFISFLPFAISTAIVPSISEAVAKNNKKSLHVLIKKSLIFTLIPVIILSINIFLSGNELMQLIFATNEGTNYLKILTVLFILYYLSIPLVASLQSIGLSKRVFVVSTSINILRTILLTIFSFSNTLCENAVIISTTIAMIINFIVLLVTLIISTKLKFNLNIILQIIFITIIAFSIGLVLKNLNVNYIIIGIITFIIVTILSKWLKLVK